MTRSTTKKSTAPVRKTTAAKKATATKKAVPAVPKKQTKSLRTTTSKTTTHVVEADVVIASVPEKSAHESYITRKFDGNRDDFTVYNYALHNRLNVLAEGATGTGKTSSVLAFAAKHGLRFGSVSSSVGLDPSQLFGRFVPDGKGSFVWVDGLVTNLVRHGGVLLLNEVNFIPERISTVLFSLTDKRREIQLQDHHGEVIRAHVPTIYLPGGIEDKCWCDLSEKECRKRWLLIVADLNPQYEGTRPMNKAFRNRFGLQLQFHYDNDIESKLVRSKSILDMATALRSRANAGEFRTPISTNMLMELERLTLGLGFDFASMNFANHFQPEERNSVKLVLDTYAANIQSDVAPDEDSEEEYDEKDPNYGITWVFDDEDINDVRARKGLPLLTDEEKKELGL